MPKGYQQPNPNWHQTHATNANAHPGNVVKEVLGNQWKQEEIKKDKKAWEERREAKEEQKAKKQRSIQRIADFENTMALQDKIEETSFPQHQTEGKQSGPWPNTYYNDAPTFSESSDQTTGQER